MWNLTQITPHKSATLYVNGQNAIKHVFCDFCIIRIDIKAVFTYGYYTEITEDMLYCILAIDTEGLQIPYDDPIPHTNLSLQYSAES